MDTVNPGMLRPEAASNEGFQVVEAVGGVTRRRRGGWLKAAFRAGVGGSVIALLLWRSDLGTLPTAMGTATPLLVLGALVVMVAFLLASALRWHVFLQPLGIGLRAGPLLRLSLVGVFFNAFLPTGVGGDAYKAIRLKQPRETLARPVASVLLDRWAGLIGLALLGLAGALAELPSPGRGSVVVMAALSCLGILAGSALLVLIGSHGGRSFDGRGRWRLRATTRRALEAVVATARRPRTAGHGIAAGVLAQALLLLTHLLAARALRIDISLAALAGIVVVATLMAAVPLSINGLGFREGAYVWALTAYGATQGQALAFALVMLALLLAASAVGGIVYVVSGGGVQPRDLRADT